MPAVCTLNFSVPPAFSGRSHDIRVAFGVSPWLANRLDDNLGNGSGRSIYLSHSASEILAIPRLASLDVPAPSSSTATQDIIAANMPSSKSLEQTLPWWISIKGGLLNALWTLKLNCSLRAIRLPLGIDLDIKSYVYNPHSSIPLSLELDCSMATKVLCSQVLRRLLVATVISLRASISILVPIRMSMNLLIVLPGNIRLSFVVHDGRYHRIQNSSHPARSWSAIPLPLCEREKRCPGSGLMTSPEH